MKLAAFAGVAITFIATAAFAQSNIGAPRTTENPPAVASPSDVNKTTAAPVAGKNSFTKEQVAKRLQDNGYTAVSDLMQDDKSIWRGKAMMSGKPVSVAVRTDASAIWPLLSTSGRFLPR